MLRKISIVLVIVLIVGISFVLIGSQLPEKVFAKAMTVIPMGHSLANAGYTLTHVGSQKTVTDQEQCSIYGKFTKDNAATGSLNYRVYIDDIFTGTFAAPKGGKYFIDLNSTCVPRFGDGKCVNFQTKFSKNVEHTIKIEVNINDAWYFANNHAPFPKKLTCQTEAGVVNTPTSTELPPVPTVTSTPVVLTEPSVSTELPPKSPSYILNHVGSQDIVTDMSQCKVYGNFTKKTGVTGSINYRVYIDNAYIATFASAKGGSYTVNLDSTCVKRFGDNKCINFREKFSKNTEHSIKIEANVDGKWYFASNNSPFPKTLNCQTETGPTRTPTNTAIPPTATAKPPTKTPTSVPKPYALQNTVFYTTNFLHPDLGCNWTGIAGQVFNNGGNPIINMVVAVAGTLDGKNIELLALTGMATDYGTGGYEIQLADQLVNSTGSLTVTIYDLAGTQLTDPVLINTYTDCSKGLIIANFKQK